jgi:hypothetical protein
MLQASGYCHYIALYLGHVGKDFEGNETNVSWIIVRMILKHVMSDTTLFTPLEVVCSLIHLALSFMFLNLLRRVTCVYLQI